MSKDTNLAARLEIVERQLAELQSLAPIMTARKAEEEERRRIESAENEARLKAEKAAAELESLRGFLDADPLVRVSVAHGPGASFICSLEYPVERGKLSGGRLAISAEGSPAIGGSYLPAGWSGRASDWAKITAASTGEIDRALKGGLIELHVYPTDVVLADAKLRRSWWFSSERPT